MNLLILYGQDFIAPNYISLNDYRYKHLVTIKKVSPGQCIKAGLLNANMGTAQVVLVDDKHIELTVDLSQPPPEPLNVHLILALPRPKMLKRILQTVSAMGVKQLSLIHSAKVEKSYWQTPWLQKDKLNQHLILGLQQAGDTILPRVDVFQRFKPFVEDILPVLTVGRQAVLAHPGQGDLCLSQQTDKKSTLLAIGPEGGFIQYEVDKLIQAGFHTCHLGERILRVENAIPVLLGRLL